VALAEDQDLEEVEDPEEVWEQDVVDSAPNNCKEMG
jgi:hypothetical protein